MSRRDWSEWIFPATSAAMTAFLVYHLAVGHDAMGDRGLPGAAAVDTAALRARPLPLVVPVEIPDTDRNDGVTTTYGGAFTLDRLGLRFASNFWMRPRYDSTLAGPVGTDRITLALAERAPYGWRIVKAGAPAYEYCCAASWGRGLRGPGSEIEAQPDTMRIDGVTPLDLVGRFPVIVHDLVLGDGRTDERTRIQVFSVGDPSIFERLLAPKPWEAAATPR